MTAAPAPRRVPSTSSARSAVPRSRSAAPRGRSPQQTRAAERRHRARHFRRRRRDLLQDLGLALALTLLLVSLTAGLGALALLEVPLAGGLLASMVIERRRRPDPSRGRRPSVRRGP